MAKSGSIYKQKNSKFFWIKYYLPGNPNPIRESTKTEDQEEAQKFLWRRLGEVATGKFIGLEPERVRVNDLLDMVVEDYENNELASTPDMKCRLKRHVRPFFGNLKAATVGSRHVQAYIAKRKKEKGKNGNKTQNATINRELSLVHKAFKMGFEAEPQLVLKPLPVKFLVEDNIRDGIVPPEHYLTLRQSLPEPYCTFFVLGYHLGMRRGELGKIQWTEVDLEKKEIRLKRYNTKTKQQRVLPIYGDMGEFLSMAKSVRDTLYPKCPWVFQVKGEKFKFWNSVWHHYLKKAGLPHHLFHDLRRTAATNMIEAGFSEKEAMEITGHKTAGIFRRYQIVRTHRLQEMGQRMEAYFKTTTNTPGIVTGIGVGSKAVN